MSATTFGNGMLFYRAVRRLFLLLARPMFRFRIEGAENVPASGAAVVVSPHRSWLDPPCVGAACRRPVRFLIADTVYHTWFATWFYRGMRSIPVARDGRASTASLREALRTLRDGGVVGVFPEGRVIGAHETGRVHPGAAVLSVRTGAPVIAVGIQGSDRAWPHHRRFPGPAPVRVWIEKPILPPSDGDPGAMERMRSLVETVIHDLRRAVDDGR
jgi:1-acyl-sn-glycerol-3-phosphate acyltransferase